MKRQKPPAHKDILVKELRSLADRIEAGDLEAYKIALRLIHKPKERREKHVPPFDAFKVLRDEGEAGLRRVLEPLDLTELRDVLLAYGLDRQQLARKWRNKERLRRYIIERLLAHFKSGEVFLRS